MVSVIDNINQNTSLKTDIFQHILKNFIYNPVLATKIINEIDKDVLDNLREVLKVCGNNEFPKFLPFIHFYNLYITQLLQIMFRMMLWKI